MLYKQFLPSNANSITVEMGYMQWQGYWQCQDVGCRPGTILKSLKIAKEFGMFPPITILLQIFATLPVTTANSERSYSSLKYIKNLFDALL